MAFNNCLKEISGKLANIYTNKKTSQHLITNLNKQFEDLRDHPFNDDCLSSFVKIVEQFTLILIQHSSQIDGNEKYIPIFRASLHSILSVIDTHRLYGRFILKSSTMLNKFFECPTNTLSLKEFFKFYNLCLTRADKNSIQSLALKHKVTCFKTFNWIKLVRDPEFQFVLTETVCRLIENNSTLFEFFANEPDLKKSFDSIDLKQPYGQIREFVSLINAKREDLYSVICKRITIDGNIMENVVINNETLPLYLYFDMYDSKVSFFCNENMVSEIFERPFNNLEFVTFLSHETKENSILNLTPNNRLDKYRNFIFCASDQLDNFTEFVKIVFSPLFPPTSQIVLEGSFDSTIFNNISRCDTSRSSAQSTLLNTLSEEVNLECNNMKTQLDNGHDTSLLDRALMTSPTAEMSMLSTTFETLNDIYSDEDIDEEITMRDTVTEGQTEVVKRRNSKKDEPGNPINEQTVNKPNPVQMDHNQVPNQTASTETSLIITIEENLNSKVTRWLETTDDVEIIDDVDDKNAIEIDDQKIEAEPTDKVNGEHEYEDECIVISDEESDTCPTRLECVINKETVLENSNKESNETKILTVSIYDDPDRTKSIENQSNCDNNVIISSNNHCSDNNNNEDIHLIGETILDIPAKAANIDEILINNSHQIETNNDNDMLNVSEAHIETEIDQIVNTESVINKNVTTEKRLSTKNDKQPLNTNELLSILEDTDNETKSQPIIILSSNKTAPKKRKSLFIADETKFYEFSSGEFSEQQKNKSEPNNTTVKQSNYKQQSKLSNKKVIKRKNYKEVSNKSKEKKNIRKKKAITTRKSDRNKKQTEFFGFNGEDIKISTTQKRIIENNIKMIIESFSGYDFEKSKEVSIEVQKHEAFQELKDYVLNKRKKWNITPKSMENNIDAKTVNKFEDATKPLESIDNNVGDKSKQMTISDDEIVSPFKSAGYNRRKKRVLSSESSDFDKRQACQEFNNDINEENDNSPESAKKAKCTNESDKINIISNITLNGPLIEADCVCLQDFYDIVKREVDFRKYHHPQLTKIPDLIKQALKL